MEEEERKMRHKKLLFAVLAIALFLIPVVSAKSSGTFDQWGYNYTARIFNGPLGYYEENRPGGDGSPDTFFGIYTTDEWTFIANDGIEYEVFFTIAGTKLVMKWSIAWHMAVFGADDIRYNGDELSWADAVAQYGEAWCTNHDVGSGTIDGVTYEKMRGYSRIVWVGDSTGYTNPVWGATSPFVIVHKVVNAPGVALVFDEPLYSG